MNSEQKEFHFGIHVTQIVDMKVMAESAEEAQEKFVAASGIEGGLKEFPQTILEKNYELLGMIEGPLPTPPSGITPERATTGEGVH